MNKKEKERYSQMKAGLIVSLCLAILFMASFFVLIAINESQTKALGNVICSNYNKSFGGIRGNTEIYCIPIIVEPEPDHITLKINELHNYP